MRFLRALTTLAAVLAASTLVSLVSAAEPGGPGDFSFIHCSDVHVPPGVTRRTGPDPERQFGSTEVIAQIKTLTQPISLPGYGVEVPAPSFAIATGDLTEFGGLSGWWQQYLDLWKGAPFPVYHQSGNHDSTWACQRHEIRKLHGSPYYSFDAHGCHFIGWDSATPQDPRPSFGEEGIRWLKEDLKRVSRSTPIFLFCHHPIDSNELASLYERDRLLDLLRPYNVALILVGHGHAAQHRVVAGVDQVMGGSTFGNAPGYSVVSVKDGVLRVAYRRAWEPAPRQPLLERPLRKASRYPRITFQAPRDSANVEAGLTTLRVRIDRDDLESATWQADDVEGRTGTLQRDRREWRASVDTSAWEPGCHYLRVTFRAKDGEELQRTTRFYVEAPEKRVLWRARMGGSGKGSPAAAGDLVVAGAGDGGLYAFSRESGKRRWLFRTGGEILAQPLAHGDAFYVGSGDCRFYAVDRRGRQRWSFEVGDPVYSAAVAVGDTIVFAANNGRVYALAAADGRKLWERAVADYSIESRPWLEQGTLYYGAWDSHVYALDAATGEIRWKAKGAGSAASLPGVARYYSPADAGPVVAGRRVWIADRMYRLSLLDPETGTLGEQQEKVSSVARSEDGSAVYLRGTDGNLRKLAADGTPLWTAAAGTGFIPSAPAEQDRIVYSAGGTGRIVALAAADGRRLWEYQVTPRLYVFSDPVPAGGVVYVTGMDGSLTALRGK
ncbi:MAG: PQQ-binding-like beta-propeller repeat protein [Armatimonadota bacterium]